MHLMARVLCLISIFFTAHMAAAQNSAPEEVDLELVLLADSSGSIDDSEIRFQRQGYASAMADPEVLSAIASGLLGRIAVTYVEWGDQFNQDVVVPWMVVSDEASAKAFGDRLMAEPREAFGRNAIGSALMMAQGEIAGNAFEGMRKVIDLSADSANSWNGIPLEEARARVIAAGTTINGLAVLCRNCSGRPVNYDLEQAFEQRIIGGPEHFVITVDGPQRFALAVRTKLIREIAGKPPASDGDRVIRIVEDMREDPDRVPN
jgi:hypothetical protein